MWFAGSSQKVEVVTKGNGLAKRINLSIYFCAKIGDFCPHVRRRICGDALLATGDGESGALRAADFMARNQDSLFLLYYAMLRIGHPNVPVSEIDSVKDREL